MKSRKVKITITLSKSLLRKIDKERDDVPRSRYIEKLLRRVIK